MRKYLFSVSKYCSAQLKLDLEHKIFLSTDFYIILNLLAEEVEGWDDEVVPVKTFLSSADTYISAMFEKNFKRHFVAFYNCTFSVF